MQQQSLAQWHSSGMSRAGRSRSGFTMIEVTVCTLIVGTLVVAALRTTGSVLRFRSETTAEQRGIQLAEVLMTRIELLPYHDPDGDSRFGREFLEVYFNSPVDDMDDYHGFSESPPKSENGTPLPGFADWGWSVQMARVNPVDLSETPSDQGALKIVVTVQKQGAIVATLYSIHVDAKLMELN